MGYYARIRGEASASGLSKFRISPLEYYEWIRETQEEPSECMRDVTNTDCLVTRSREGIVHRSLSGSFTVAIEEIMNNQIICACPEWATRLDQDQYGLYAVLDLVSGFETRLRWIPPGRFLMGSPENETGRFGDEGPQHGVEITKGFWLADAPCTQAEWEAIMGSNPSKFKGEPQCPVEQVSWDDCQEFCRKLKERWPSFDARLPTEAEWEYACRAGTTGAYNDGSDCTVPEGKDHAMEKLGWYYKNSDWKTHPVRKLAPNAWGIHDAHGNVWEWCQDYFGDYSDDKQIDPTGPVDGTDRVLRGGCFFSRARYCRSAYRGGWLSTYRFDVLGFRFASGQKEF